jgi:hypothetical protein
MKFNIIKPTKMDLFNLIVLISIFIAMYKGRILDEIVFILLAIWVQLMNIYEKVK